MEINDNNVRTLINYLQQTLSHDEKIRKPAEKYLESIEGTPGYTLLLLHVIEKREIDLVIRISSSIIFKNCVRRNWNENFDTATKLSVSDRNSVKATIISLMLKSEEQIQRQLSDAISIIGRQDFPAKWPNLLDEMITIMANSGGDFNTINGLLRTSHSLFKRYRHEFKSQALWLEIKFVLERFAKPFTDLFLATVSLAETHATNPSALKVIFSSLVLCAKIFNSLNAQDLPEFFEDNIQVWMENFLKLLSIDNKLLLTDDDEEAGLLEQLKSQICDNIGMYAQKYHEEFAPYLPGFVESVWHLLTSTGIEPKFDLLVCNAIHFVSIVADRVQYQNLFTNEGVLDSLCVKVIIPNIQFRCSDEEMFEDNPDEFIRRDIEGSDIDTRRRAACDLIKSLSRYFEAKIIEIFGVYIQTMLADFAKSPSEHWKSKDAALYLVTAMSVKGFTARDGTTKTSELVNTIDFFDKYVKTDLISSANLNDFPVLRADALKYLITFRNLLPLNEVVLPAFPVIIQHLTAPSVVVHTYAAHAIERLLTMMDPNKRNQTLIKYEHISAHLTPLIQNLFNIFSLPGSAENEYAMKAIMRTLSLLNENILPILTTVIEHLIVKLREISRNPSKPFFNHYLFESISLCVRAGCKQNPTALETLLFPLFQDLLVNDVSEFMPYVFQILSMLLEVRTDGVSKAYLDLFAYLLSPILWDRPGNIHPMVRLLQAFIEKGAKDIVENGKLSPLLGVFQKLIASKCNDHEGFYLLESLIEFMPPNDLEPFIKQIFILLFTRLSNSKTGKFVKCLLVCFSLFIYKYGVNYFIATIDGIQAKMFSMVIERLYIAEMQKVSGTTERKIVAVGVINLLTQLQSLIQGEYTAHWTPLLAALINLFELPEDDSVPEDEHFIEIEETPGYQAGYSQLVFASKKEHDIFNGTVDDPRLYLATSLATVTRQYPGVIVAMISTGLSQDAATCLKKYCELASVTLS